jgi:hypothetical protein
MKTIYTIEDFMKELGISNRATFWRKRKSGMIPEPDIKFGHPRWFRRTIQHLLPS